MILVGSAVAQNNGKVTLSIVAGMNTLGAVRLTNYLTKPLLVTNINDGYQSQELLPPQTTMVYKSPNTTESAFVVGQAVGAVVAATAAQIVNGLTVEWATDPVNDFLGTYPALVGALA